jgi:hypothetical protein
VSVGRANGNALLSNETEDEVFSTSLSLEAAANCNDIFLEKNVYLQIKRE